MAPALHAPAVPSVAVPARLPRRVLLLLAALALTVRAVHLAQVRPTAMMEYHRTYAASDMALMADWGRHIAGDWLLRQSFHPLTRWQLEVAPEERWRKWYGEASVYFKAPFYGYLIAVAYRAFDDPMLPLAVLQVLASTAAVALLAALTARTFGAAAGIVAGALFAAYAPAVHYDVLLLRGTWITVAALLAVWQLVRLREQPTTRRALALGLVAGVAILVNEGFTLLPLLLLPCLPASGGVRRWLRLAAAALLGTLLALVPLVARNLAVGAPPLSLMVNASSGFAIHNAATSNPLFYDSRPAGLAELLQRSDGGLAATAIACARSFDGPLDLMRFYFTKAVGLVVPFENPDNVNFYYARRLSPALRLLPTYTLLFPLAAVGLFLARRRWRAALAWLPAVAALLVSLLVTIALSRYRAPLAVLLMPFAGLAVAELVAAVRERHWRGAVALGAAALTVAGVAALLERRVLFAAVDRAALEYRAPEHILGARFHAERGNVAGIVRELGVLVRHHPDPRTRLRSLLMLADLAAGAGDAAVARRALGAAVRLGSDAPEVLVMAGDVYRLRLGDSEEAVALYRRAAAVDRRGRWRQLIRERLAAGESGM